MTEDSYNAIKKLIGFITIAVGILLLLKTEHERDLAIITTDGKCIDDFSSFDLMMLPKKKEGWVNLIGSNHNPHILDVVWDTKEEALDFRRKLP